MTTILIRADSSNQIGMGHITRMLVIASELRKSDFEVIFATKNLPGNINTKIENAGFEIVILQEQEGTTELCNLINQRSARLVIFDHYAINQQYEQEIQELTKQKIMCIDDLFHPHCCDLLLNQNVYADPKSYQDILPDHCTILAGPTFCMLRDEFTETSPRDRQANFSKEAKILVTLGGSDPDNMTLKVMRALEMIDQVFLQAHVIIGESNRYYDKLSTFAKDCTQEIKIFTDTTQMAQLMNWADIAICAGGTTTFELLQMQLPSVVGVLADNQEQVTETLHAMNLSHSIGWYDRIPLRSLADAIEQVLFNDGAKQIEKMKQLDITNGKKRVVKAIKQLLFHDYQLREATPDDSMDVFHLSSDPTVREQSLHPEIIELSKHEAWFPQKLNDENCLFYIITDRTGNFLGQIRFEQEEADNYIISISLSRRLRGSGLGSEIIEKAEQKLRQSRQVDKVVAMVKPTNVASMKIFQKAAYTHRK